MKSTLELIIDTTNNEEIVVGFAVDGRKDIRQTIRPLKKSQIVLPLIESLLETHQKTLADITAITVNPGPGSFTGIRVGLSIANTLAVLYAVPVNGKKVGELEQAVYE
jgi:tRNA threonylcarbamoyladenosine biosynthesis protein TsaB